MTDPRHSAARSRPSALETVFINRDYALFMLGSFISATGSWAQSVAIGWLVLELGNSAFLLGLTNFAAMVPLLVLGFPAGAIVDRYDRRTLIFIAQGGLFICWATLAAAAVFHFISIPLILLTSALGGLFNALGWPTWSVYIKDLVGPEKLRAAVALNSARFNLTRVIGPAVAGVILASYGAAVCLVAAALCMLAILVALLFIPPKPVEEAADRAWLPALKEGLVYAWSERAVRDLLLLTAALGFFIFPYQAFLPAFARDVLGTGPEGYGYLLTAVGIGALAGAGFAGSRWAARYARPVIVITAALSGIALAAAALSASLHVAVVALAILGLVSISYLAVANASVQLATRDDLVGRVMGLWTVVNAGTTPVGSLAIGAASESVGLTTSLAGAGIACALCGVVAVRAVEHKRTVKAD